MAKVLINNPTVDKQSGFRVRDNAGVIEVSYDGGTNYLTATELAILDGVTATATEINNALDASSRVVSLITTTTLTPAAHGNGKYVTLDLLAGFTTTVPAATGSGDQYYIAVGTVNTSNSYIIALTGDDTFEGSVVMIDSDTVADSATGFVAGATADKITLNGTTTGGFSIGDYVLLTDVAADVFHVSGQLTGSGAIATPFGAS